uniref:Mitoguardin 1 n=1 Tax=Xenopus laevis TaxID=8355 RepID=MIGA1_XENLA|nr:RecName: Full=Mitoguardin 1; AltName: Full=Protein FAM73A [Xenopus laevis]AAH70842.1 MGC84571 protein [Xenopus laevis]
MTETQHIFRLTVHRFMDFPLSIYSSFTQLKPTPGLKKIIAVAAISGVSLIFLACHLKRKRGKKKINAPQTEPGQFILQCSRHVAEKGSSCSSSRQNLTLSLGSIKERGSQSHLNGDLCSKYSGSMQSLASVQSCHSCACINSNSWDKTDEDEINIPVTTPENLYLMGMELFEEALRRWEQALTFRSRQAEDEANCSSIKLGAGDAIAEENIEDVISADFIHKLEALLQRAYRLQEEFEATLGASDPASLANDIDKDTDITVMDNGGDFQQRDTLSIASTDSFLSAAELADNQDMRATCGLDSLYHHALYEEAMQLAEEGKVHCRVLRTEMLECLGDSDFLAKLHCIRQAFQEIILQRENRIFLMGTGRKLLSALIVKARKNPKKFEDAYFDMMSFLEQPESWDTVEKELLSRGMKCMNFYDIVLDFIVMDSLEDLENPPLSIQNVVRNRWLNSSFKETAVTSSCWSVLRQKKQEMKVPNGFFANFYTVCEQLCPVLAWGFLGPRSSLHDLCCFYKAQIMYFLKDIFDFEKVRYSDVEHLAEDIMKCLQRRTELTVVYTGEESARRPPVLN